MQKKLQAALKYSLSRLSLLQNADGSFSDTTYATSFILSCLDPESEHPDIQRITKQGIGFLLREKNSHWSWNYWKRSSEQYITTPYPDDLDDTFLALNAISMHAPHLIDGSVMVSMVHLLIEQESQPGGPYFTWITESDLRETWNDIDPVTNATINSVLNRHHIPLPPLEQYLHHVVHASHYQSLYYTSPLVVGYFLTRGIHTEHVQAQLRDHIRMSRHSDTSYKNPMETALAITGYLKAGGNLEEMTSSLEYLLELPRAEWELPHPLFVERIKDGVMTPHESSAETLACIIEAFTTCLALFQEVPEETSEQKAVLRSLVNACTERYATLGSDMSTLAAQHLRALLQSPSRSEIALMPHLFAPELEHLTFTHEPSTLDLLSRATLFGWLGYGVADAIIDHETPTHVLPMAVIAMREASQLFHNEIRFAKTHTCVEKILDGINRALFVESRTCRVPVINRIVTIPTPIPKMSHELEPAQKSLGHALGPFILLSNIDHPESEAAAHDLVTIFAHYLTARQLHDDAHDWYEDLSHGILNPVGCMMCEAWLKHHPDERHLNLDFYETKLRTLFWDEMIDTVSEKINHHVDMARALITATDLFSYPEAFHQALDRLSTGADHAIYERDQMKKFLRMM